MCWRWATGTTGRENVAYPPSMHWVLWFCSVAVLPCLFLLCLVLVCVPVYYLILVLCHLSPVLVPCVNLALTVHRRCNRYCKVCAAACSPLVCVVLACGFQNKRLLAKSKAALPTRHLRRTRRDCTIIKLGIFVPTHPSSAGNELNMYVNESNQSNVCSVSRTC